MPKAVSVERRIIGTVSILPPGTPPVTPPVTYEEILKIHKLVKGEIDSRAEKGKCVTPEEIANVLGLTPDVVATHIEILKSDQYVVHTDEKEDARICSREALNRLYESLGRLVFHRVTKRE
jgi:hypothetical protein